jgi:hypothetical protein
MSGFRSLIIASLLTLTGCASGIQSDGNYPSETFIVDAGYDAAYRRASEFVRVCHVDVEYAYGVSYGYSRSLDEKTAIGTVSLYKIPEPAKLLEIVRAKPDGPLNTSHTATVTVTVLGDGPWDAQEIAAAKKSIQSATPICRPGGK